MAVEIGRTFTSHRIGLEDERSLYVQEWPGRSRPIVLLLRPVRFLCRLVRTGLRNHSLLSGRRPPGFGRSSPPSRPRLGAYADDVVYGVRRLGVHSCMLVAHSLGGGVAPAVAERMPDTVLSLVLCAPVGFGRLPLAELAACRPVRELTAGALPYVLTKPFLLAPVYATLVTRGIDTTDDLLQRLTADARRMGPGVRAGVGLREEQIRIWR